MTETKIKKFDGKHVRFRKNAFPHSVEINEYEGVLTISEDPVSIVRGNKTMTYMHVGFYLETSDLKHMLYFDYRAIKTIIDMEEIKDEDRS